MLHPVTLWTQVRVDGGSSLTAYLIILVSSASRTRINVLRCFGGLCSLQRSMYWRFYGRSRAVADDRQFVGVASVLLVRLYAFNGARFLPMIPLVMALCVVVVFQVRASHRRDLFSCR